MGSHLWYARIGSDNRSARNRRQAIIWINYGPLCWRIYASPSIHGLKRLAFIVFENYTTSQKYARVSSLVFYLFLSVHGRLMKTSSNGNMLRVTGPLWGESTGHRRIPLTTVSDAELWSAPATWLSKQSKRRRLETPPHSLWRHSHVFSFFQGYFTSTRAY